MSSKTLKVKMRTGLAFEVNISEKACKQFGFGHGDRIIDPNGNKGIIVGVAPYPEGTCSSMFCGEKDCPARKKGENILWYSLDGDGGRVSFHSDVNKIKLIDQSAQPEEKTV